MTTATATAPTTPAAKAPKAKKAKVDPLALGPTGPAAATAAAAGTAAPTAPEAPAAPQANFNDDFAVVDMDIASLKPGTLRVVDEAKVLEMVRSIRACGLQEPIVVTADNVVQNGNHRLAAFIKMGRKKIPARYAFDPKAGSNAPAMASTDPASRFQALAANLIRNPMSPVQRGRVFREMLNTGVATDAKTLAGHIGVSASNVSRDMKLAEQGVDALREALEADRITAEAADAIISRTADKAEQAQLLATLLKASEGKLTLTAVDAVAPKGAGTAKPSKGGPRPTKAVLAPEALNTDTSNVTGHVRKSGDGTKYVVLTLELEAPANFNGYDLAAKVQAAVAKIDPAAIRAELALASKRLDGQ